MKSVNDADKKRAGDRKAWIEANGGLVVEG